jgi:ABC-2 type transport system ATP-binding protein
MNTHILSDVEMLCDRVAVIVHGRIRYQGRIEDFLERDARVCEVVVSGLAPEVVQNAEENLGAELRGHGERIAVRLAEKHVSEALQLFLSTGAQILSVTPERASLEDIFMSAVRQGEQEGQA